METPTNHEPCADLDAVRLDQLRRAADLYLGIAYPSGPIPASVARRLEWDPTKRAGVLLGQPPFENVGTGPMGGPIVALRLGNYRYPHMKMQVQTWQSADGFLLSVNTHDQVMAIDPKSSDASAFRVLQEENQRLKQAIEQAWDEAAIPTFNRYLLDYIAANRSSNNCDLI